MAENDAPERDALARARHTRVVVIGGGVAGLVAALEWAKIGAPVTVLEASDRFGGAVETVLLDGMPVDLVADAFPLAAPAWEELLDDLDLRALVEPAAAHPVWIAGLPGAGDRASGGAAPMPPATILGIPANPWATDVRRIIGWRGAWRAYLDRLRPPLTIGHERSLGRLVRSRMGDRVADCLVAPVSRGLYGVGPDDVDVEIAAPGLSTALTRTGSLAGAAFDLLPADPDAPTRATLRGGMGVLVAALIERLTELGADLRVGSRASSLRRGDDWHVAVARTDEVPEGDAPADPSAPGPGADDDVVRADVVVVATSGATASSLLGTVGVAIDAPPTVDRDIVTLVVDAPGLSDAPRGRAVFPVSADDPAVVVATADWPWLAALAGPARHVIRVTLAAERARSDEQAIADAARAAEALLAQNLSAPRAGRRRRVELAPPASALDHAARVAAVRAAAAGQQGLCVVGTVTSGSGLAQIVADTIGEVDEMRSSVIWTDGARGGEGLGDPQTAAG